MPATPAIAMATMRIFTFECMFLHNIWPLREIIAKQNPAMKEIVTMRLTFAAQDTCYNEPH